MENFEKVLMGLVIPALVLSIFSFIRPNNGAIAEENALDKIRTRSEIDVCFINYMPYSYRNLETGGLQGISVDIIENIAEKMNVTVNYHETTWGNIVLDLQSKRCHANISGIFSLIERANGGVIFSEAYGYLGNNGIVKKEDNRFKSIEELNQEGITIAVVAGEASHVYAQSHLAKAQLNAISSDDQSLAFVEVSTGRADVGLSDAIATELYLREHDDVKLLLEKDYLLRESTFALNENDIKLLNFLNNAIEVMAVSGEIEEIYAKYEFDSIIPRIADN